MREEHQIVEISLHRFTNPAGVPWSAIYEGDFEYFSCERSKELEMIQTYINRKFPDALTQLIDYSLLDSEI